MTKPLPINNDSKKPRTAFVIGATGFVGQLLVKQLCEDAAYEKIITFSRHELTYTHPKLEQQIDSFDHLNETSLVGVDDVFCCLGTTIKKAGSQEAFRKVDYHYPMQVATLVKQLNIKHFIIISAMGANAASRTFYMRTKGQLEDSLKSLQLNRLSIIRPSLLIGERDEFRLGEKAGEWAFKLFKPLLRGSLRKMRPVSGNAVAHSMKKIALSPKNQAIQIYESGELIESNE